MTMSSSAVPTADLNALAGDNPFVLATNVITSGATGAWYTGSSGGSTITDSAYPVYLACNGVWSDVTQPLALADRGASTATIRLDVTFEDPTLSWDTIALSHNLGAQYREYGVATDVQFYAYDAGAEYLLATATNVTTDRRLVFYNLSSDGGSSYNRRLTNALGILVRFTVASGYAHTIQVGHLQVGQRLQLSNSAQQGYDVRQLEHKSSDLVTDGGNIYRYRYASRGRRVEGVWDCTSSSRYGLDDITTIESWKTQCLAGAKPFLWCEHPYSERHDAYRTHAADWMYLDSTIRARQMLTGHREVEIAMTESAPYREEEA